MSKRADGKFERVANDFYATPPEAVPALIPHLRAAGVRTFAEPCYGEGHLARHLEGFGLTCTYGGDLRTGQDALATSDYGQPDAVITNPPFKRRAMHALIRHFERIAPTWLFVEWDWVATQQAAPLMRSCTDVVVIGRLKLFPGTPNSGFDNFCWVRFDHRHRDGPRLHPFRAVLARPRPNSRACARCARPFRGRRADADFCSNGCRQAAYRARVEP